MVTPLSGKYDNLRHLISKTLEIFRTFSPVKKLSPGNKKYIDFLATLTFTEPNIPRRRLAEDFHPLTIQLANIIQVSNHLFLSNLMICELPKWYQNV
jgi:hypothetical protein